MECESPDTATMPIPMTGAVVVVALRVVAEFGLTQQCSHLTDRLSPTATMEVRVRVAVFS